MIDDWIIFSKTQLGNDEILRRTVGLPPDLRSLLLLIDGRRDFAMLRNVAVSVRESGAPLVYLEDNGFVARTGVNEARVPQGTGSADMAPRRTLLNEINQTHLQTQSTIRPDQAAPRAAMPAQAARAPSAAPPQAQTSYYPAPQTARAPIGSADAFALNDIKSAMIQFVSQALGADGGHAVGRIQSAPSVEELQQIARKIYDVLKSYAGVKSAETFMQRFEGPLKLR
jgi:hypothetical protein